MVAPTIVALDAHVLRHLCNSLTEGLKSHEVAISSQCAAALEHLAAFHFREISEENESVSKLAAEFNVPLTCIGVPKTIDNDLAVTDCCPGFGSAAK